MTRKASFSPGIDREASRATVHWSQAVTVLKLASTSRHQPRPSWWQPEGVIPHEPLSEGGTDTQELPLQGSECPSPPISVLPECLQVFPDRVGSQCTSTPNPQLVLLASSTWSPGPLRKVPLFHLGPSDKQACHCHEGRLRMRETLWA